MKSYWITNYTLCSIIQPHTPEEAETSSSYKQRKEKRATAARDPPPPARSLRATLSLRSTTTPSQSLSLFLWPSLSLSRNFDQRLEVKEVEVCNTYAAIHGFFFRIKICHWFQFKKLQGKSSYGEEELELMDSQVCEVLISSIEVKLQRNALKSLANQKI
ncbi:hypothetical protein QL285_085617 [Trifolium repens]|nr:hypothetical protein QL285_085617 [Trifolium repens]